ncbi:Thiolase-like protein [Pseudocohnilembus persalinus]|uniref:acetyl-CoA C-acetyltransferase n=1 Tax=Pseudocohnilembus persalinus TaxID=266149 RepID=A0A0V0R3Z2_PSEPJ|nr:Thiolase-like protein [Pseudocohnilembus persalinus]|eukprot:KRX09203.1 Thiolase-like protein [Pseudocohnilembus persalinus]
MQKKEVFIVAAKRSAIGSFNGVFSELSGPQLAGQVIQQTLQSANLDPKIIDEVILGNVCQAGQGQNPTRQAALAGGIPMNVPCTTVNKVCASGMKTVMMGAQAIQSGDAECILAGGYESMSNIPFYVQGQRRGSGFGHQQLSDGLQLDGLTNVYDQNAMGFCAEKTATDFKITREENDQFCVKSYERVIQSGKNKVFEQEIVPVQTKKGPVIQDQEPTRYKPNKISQLKPAFVRNGGTITAANASKINDGACIIILMSAEKLQQTGAKPLAKIVSYADAEVAPVDFCIAPASSGEKALKKANLQVQDMDFFEFNEAFSTTTLANMKILNVPHEKVNVHGGAVALGHPLGMSGARIILSLVNVLNQKQGKYGMAGICNGGGGGSSIIIQRV